MTKLDKRIFADLPLTGGAYVAVFAVSYIFRDIFYGVNELKERGDIK